MESVLGAVYWLCIIAIFAIIAIVALLGGVLAYMKMTKPQLPGPGMFTLGARFKAQREDVRIQEWFGNAINTKYSF